MNQPDDLYAAQVVWDESMAEASATWLSERHPARQLVIMAGNMHCHDSAIPARIRRRMKMGATVVSVVPIVRKDGENLGERLAGYDYGFVMMPKGQKDT
jgi:uncharacterized iron-regulated protein